MYTHVHTKNKKNTIIWTCTHERKKTMYMCVLLFAALPQLMSLFEFFPTLIFSTKEKSLCMCVMLFMLY